MGHPADYNVNYGFQQPLPGQALGQHPPPPPSAAASGSGWANPGGWPSSAWRPDHHRGGFNFHRQSPFPHMQPSNNPHDYRVKGLPPPPPPLPPSSMNGFCKMFDLRR